MADQTPVIDKINELSEWLGDPQNDGNVVKTHLQASERVIARVTDGIYREPASALRELISNAWDADAQSVTILTDAPRFSRIVVKDNGSGMSHATLSRMLKSIGGSSKRRDEGVDLGVTNASDPDYSPNGRPLIGKIGIGLFSVSQLCRRFMINTKAAGTDYRLLAEVRLRAYSEEDSPNNDAKDSDDDFLTGEVFIRREGSADLDAHGTDIVLEDLKPAVRDILRSAGRWRAVEEREKALAEFDLDTVAHLKVEPPVVHSGYIADLTISDKVQSVMTKAPRLPWDSTDAPGIRMSKLVDAVEEQSSYFERPELSNTLDTYLHMIWTLGLAAPVDYVDGHPFDKKANDRFKLFWITRDRGRGIEIPMTRGRKVRDLVREHAPGNPELKDGIDPNGGFQVIIDGIELKRPIRFRHIPTNSAGLDYGILFVGDFHPDLSRVAERQRGGELALEGYIWWTGRVVPKENNGVLVRIRGASGAPFDPQFLRYQVLETTRLRQLTSEIFVQQGLDAALNIDRESFNYAHPHVQLVSQWLHSSIRQLTNRLKAEANSRREVTRTVATNELVERLDARVRDTWLRQRGDDPIPEVAFVERDEQAPKIRDTGDFAIVRQSVPALGANASDTAIREAKTRALVQILSAYGIMDDRSYDEQQAIVAAILDVFL